MRCSAGEMDMPSVYDLKPGFQNLLRPLVKLLASTGVTANMVTMAAMLGSIIYGIWIYQPFAKHGPNPYPYLFLGLFLFIRMALNAIDGMLAREHNQQSLFGAYLNEVGDVVSDAALYLPFLDLMENGIFWVIMTGLCCLTEFVGLQGKTVGASRRYDGPFGKSDRAVFFGALGLFTAWAVFERQQQLHGTVMNWAMIIATILALFTIFNRIRRGIQEAGG